MRVLFSCVWFLGVACGLCLIGCAGAQHTTDEGLASVRPEQAVGHIFYSEPESPENRVASGTGFVVDAERGVMVTAAHVVSEGTLIDVRFGGFEGEDAPYLPAQVITLDTERDVAILKIDAAVPLKEVRLAVSAPAIGSRVSIYGFPESNIVGLEMRRSTGAISARRLNPLNRDDTETRMLELEAKIEPGNSGSPVFDESLRVVGVVSSRWETTDSYALAAPVEVIRDLLGDRFESDLSQAVASLGGEPVDLAEQAEAAKRLAEGFDGTFPEDGEGAERASMVSQSMGEVLDEGRLCGEALERGEVAVAWRHLQKMAYLLELHQPDILSLESTRKALEAVGEGGEEEER